MPQSVATFLLFGAALPLIRPRLPLPAKVSSDARDKKDEDEPENENEAVAIAVAVAVEPAQSQQDKITAKRMVKDVKLWVFITANGAPVPRGISSSSLAC